MIGGLPVKLRGADLSGASLQDANLMGADLSGARGVTGERLERQVYELGEAIMPNGQKYEDWLKSTGRRGRMGRTAALHKGAENELPRKANKRSSENLRSGTAHL